VEDLVEIAVAAAVENMALVVAENDIVNLNHETAASI
jgi:hypothetical protein